MQSLVADLRRRATLHPQRPALIMSESVITYAELWDRIQAVALDYARAGVVTGDPILLLGSSTPAFVYGYYAAHCLGAVAVPMDPQAPKSRREELIERTRPKLTFGAVCEHHPRVGPIRALQELCELPSGSVGSSDPAIDLLADVVFTTGTMGRPKGVQLSHRNIATSANHINAVICCREGDVEVLPLPLFASFGLGRLRCGLLGGRTLVLVEGFRFPGEILGAIVKHGAVGLSGVPAGFAVLLRFGARGLGALAEQLRYIEIGSTTMPHEHKRALMKYLPKTEIWMHYGLSEASRSAFIEFHRHASKLDSVGLPAPGVRMSIRDAEGRELPAGAAGALWIGGSHVSAGYWDDVAATGCSFVNGWVSTGDLAIVDESGFVHFLGRKDDMIKVGGFNVSPDEIERVLTEHPTIAEAACIGTPDPRRIAGEVVDAFVVASAGLLPVADKELASWVAARLESYKIPVRFTWLDALPRTPSGKLLRRSLRVDSLASVDLASPEIQ
jgi:long-chain acyl-CoA synthetase